jgi:pyrimidine-nucleoside phosphorylase
MTSALLPQQIIARKRDGFALTGSEIDSFVRGASDGSWGDYQLAALLMAITLRGMTAEETAELTRAVMDSGVVADLRAIGRPKVDKHSTGGVGDKISLPLAPMVVACGAAVPMISGRGLGHTGGTLDKLESIAGFNVNLSLAQYRDQIARVGAALIGQTAELAPADKKLYALRDVTATVESIPLICASIMGKKLAEGIDALVLDVKFGAGAFMADQAKARELAEAMVAIGRAMNKPVRALLTAMDQPLGHTVGNALEIREAIACLHGRGPADVMEVTYALGEQMLLLAGLARTSEEARVKLERAVDSGAALAVFREIVAAQGGEVRAVDEPDRLPTARYKVEVRAGAAGGGEVNYVQAVAAKEVAMAALRLGAGRVKAGDRIDFAVGVSDLVKIGNAVSPGARLATIHANDEANAHAACEEVRKAIKLGPEPVAPPRLIAAVI